MMSSVLWTMPRRSTSSGLIPSCSSYVMRGIRHWSRESSTRLCVRRQRWRSCFVPSRYREIFHKRQWGAVVIALLQRTNWARLTIDGQQRCEIGKGLVVFVGIEKDDDENKPDRLLHRLLSYRVFADAEGKMNLSLLDIAGDILLV